MINRMDPVFRFKQFSVRHDRCIMKVGTDGVLLGAYAGVDKAEKILDIGIGSGVIAMMLAQRSNAMVEGVEVDASSAVQAKQNAASCPWGNRIHITHASFQQYHTQHGSEFDVAVCNPPYFPDHLKSKDDNRNLARHTVNLNHYELTQGVKQVLKPNGSWWLILPYSATQRFLEIAHKEGFFLNHELIVIPKAGKKPNRKIISLGKRESQSFICRALTIRNEDDSYTEDYKKLTRSFYLAF
jgi:tRNA1Val (adenine37-N6)-methyltransferase